MWGALPAGAAALWGCQSPRGRGRFPFPSPPRAGTARVPQELPGGGSASPPHACLQPLPRLAPAGEGEAPGGWRCSLVSSFPCRALRRLALIPTRAVEALIPTQPLCELAPRAMLSASPAPNTLGVQIFPSASCQARGQGLFGLQIIPSSTWLVAQNH